MTGSLISSLVIGHRNSSGIPEHIEPLFSSSTFLRSLPRKPTDSKYTKPEREKKERWGNMSQQTMCSLPNASMRNNISVSVLSICHSCVYHFSLLNGKCERGWEWSQWEQITSVQFEHQADRSLKKKISTKDSNSKKIKRWTQTPFSLTSLTNLLVDSGSYDAS